MYNYLDNEYGEQILSKFSKATGLYVAGVYTSGKTFLKLKGIEMCEFCSYIKGDSYRSIKCEQSYQKACKESLKWQSPYFFRCHAGLVMWAVPIIANEVEIGCIICGQVLLWEVDEFFLEELKEFNTDVEDFDLLCEKVKKLEIISAQKCQSAADMLLLVVNYLVKTNNNIFLEQKNKQYWRNQIIKELEEKKINNIDVQFDYETYLKREKRLMQYIRVGNKEKIINLIPKIFVDIEVLSTSDLSLIRKRILELLTMISRAIIEAGLDAKLSMDIISKMHDDLYKYKNIEEIFEKTNEVILELVDDIFILTQGKQISVLKNARSFILSNYNKNISIDDVARDSSISSSYLSHLFKEKLNFTVNSYITRIRIEKSIELMDKRELTIGEISKKVGFNSQNYFTKIFKKYIGVTPINYRKKFL